jgi:hypothetical protein
MRTVERDVEEIAVAAVVQQEDSQAEEAVAQIVHRESAASVAAAVVQVAEIGHGPLETSPVGSAPQVTDLALPQEQSAPQVIGRAALETDLRGTDPAERAEETSAVVESAALAAEMEAETEIAVSSAHLCPLD